MGALDRGLEWARRQLRHEQEKAAYEQRRERNAGGRRRGDAAASIGRLEAARVGRGRRVVLGCQEKPAALSGATGYNGIGSTKFDLYLMMKIKIGEVATPSEKGNLKNALVRLLFRCIKFCL